MRGSGKPGAVNADGLAQGARILYGHSPDRPGLGVQMLQDLVAGRIQSSLWAHIECDDAGRFTISYPASGREGNGSCPLCAKAGEGDAGLRW